MPSKERHRLERRCSIEHEAAKGSDDRTILESVVALCSQTQIMALPHKMSPLKASFAVDTGVAIKFFPKRRI